MASLRPSRGQGKAGSDGELLALQKAPKVTSAEEAPQRRQIALRIINTPEVSDFSVTT
jgi:hypothetical protein